MLSGYIRILESIDKINEVTYDHTVDIIEDIVGGIIFLVTIKLQIGWWGLFGKTEKVAISIKELFVTRLKKT
ncbi:hypothetical protein AO843_12995 [Lysinibacillus sp. ZYM-1]|nr:hypothetical protein AO843_12995 [Lysinibacillus sp. ZYM-1]